MEKPIYESGSGYYYPGDYNKDYYNATGSNPYSEIIGGILVGVLISTAISIRLYFFCEIKCKKRRLSNKMKQVPILEDDFINECSICLEYYSKKEKKVILECGHEFHKGCILEWLDKEKTCPLCRNNI